MSTEKNSLKLPLWPIILLILLPSSHAIAKPFIPDNDAQVLERLPYAAGNPKLRELHELRNRLTEEPDNLALAVDLAWRYIELGRAESDPRYYGYAQAAVAPWWEQPGPPLEVRLLRATLRQNRHDFDGALADLTEILQWQPRNAQAWLTRAVILGVRGDPAGALRSCRPLLRLASHLIASACIGNALSLSGEAEQGYGLLRQILEKNRPAPVEEQLWVLTMLAEIAARLGRVHAAEQTFEQALSLGQRDVYLLSAYADFLLDQNRPEAVRDLLKDDTRPDALLLRLALAERRLGSPDLETHLSELDARIQAARLRGDTTHLGNQARFTLHLLGQPAPALRLALDNWAVQREPRDARLVLEAALAAQNPEAAQPVLDWLKQTRLEDMRLAALAKGLEEMRQ